MKEYPIATETPTPELPVPDPYVFLLRRANRAFVEQRSTSVYLEESPPFDRWLLGIVVGLGGGIVVIAFYQTVPLGYMATLIWLWTIAFLVYGQGHIQTRIQSQKQGILLAGDVLGAKKVAVRQRDYVYEKIRVEYHFLTPNGERHEGYGEADCAVSSTIVPPVRGTPIRVWYDYCGRAYLL